MPHSTLASAKDGTLSPITTPSATLRTALQQRICVQVYGADKALPYVVPSPNVRIECPLALVDKVLDNRPAEAREAAHAFANFLFTSEAQVCASAWLVRLLLTTLQPSCPSMLLWCAALCH
jgi:hypothetical protein